MLEHPTGRQAQENIGTDDDLAQRARIGLLGELDLVFVHQLGAPFIDHACQIGDKNVLARDAQLDEQAQAGQRRSTCARGHQLDLFGVFADHLQAIEQGCAHHNGRAMLVVMEDRNLHAVAQLALHIKTIRRFDVFEVDAAKGGL